MTYGFPLTYFLRLFFSREGEALQTGVEVKWSTSAVAVCRYHPEWLKYTTKSQYLPLGHAIAIETWLTNALWLLDAGTPSIGEQWRLLDVTLRVMAVLS